MIWSAAKALMIRDLSLLWRRRGDALQPALLDIQCEFAEMKDFPVAHRFRRI